jgi:hypothetical protein
MQEAIAEAVLIRRERPGYDIRQFLSAFRLKDDLQKIYREAAGRIGLG